MYAQDKITDFILILLRQADDEDIKTFLEYVFKKLPDVPYDENVTLPEYKSYLIKYLFSSAYSHIENNVPEIIKLVTKKWDDELEDGIPWYRGLERYEPLYLHLYALCECFYSYIIVDSKGGKVTREIATASSKYFNVPEQKVSVFKDGSLAKLLKLLINSYKENGFYYVFYNDTLVRIKFRKHTKKYYSFRFNNYCTKDTKTYSLTYYNLIDNEKKTFIVKEDLDINESLGRILTRQQPDKIHSVKGLFTEFAKNVDYDTAKYFHNKIVAVLKLKKHKEDTLCCQARMDELKEKCSPLLDKLKDIKDAIDGEEPVSDIKNFKYIDFEAELFSESSYSGLTFQQLKVNNKTYLETVIKNLRKSIKKTDDIPVYENILKLIDELDPLISESFNIE